jgi:23S rRNA (adenine2503-C2)-methyltransferase
MDINVQMSAIHAYYTAMNGQLRQSFYSLSKSDLKSFLQKTNQSVFLASKLYQYHYKNDHRYNISKRTWDVLAEHFEFNLPRIAKTSVSDDGTYKFLIEFSDGLQVESVLIPFHKRYTICLSSQVGCAMKCSFCFTGTQGLTRHLKAHEIVGQYMVVKNFLMKEISKDSLIPNIVFMGQGEPLHNFEELKKSLAVLLDAEGLALGPRQITVSTAGFIPGLARFNELPKVNLALSLHSAFDKVRSELIPINTQYPLEDLFKILDSIDLAKRQFITFEYLLIDNLNDRVEDAEALYKLLSSRKAIVNLIPFNPFPNSQYQRPSKLKVDQFKQFLVERSLRVMIRTAKGDDILAACGQLKIENEAIRRQSKY